MNKTAQTDFDVNIFLDLLRQALEDEWKAMLQYKIHASRMRGLYRDPIADHLDEHADEEQDHAERLTQHFYSHGWPIEIDIPAFNPGTETEEMIQMDLEDEIKAIHLYTQIAEMCDGIPELNDTKMLIEDILVDEVHHQDDNASFIRTKINGKELGPIERVAMVTTFVKAANNMDDLGLEELANKYTEFASEV